MSRTTPISPASDSYELHHGRLSVSGLVVATILAVLSVVFLPRLGGGWGIVAAAVMCALTLALIVLSLIMSRRVVLRADSSGLTVHGAFRAKHTVPWEHVTDVVVWKLGENGQCCLGVVVTPEHRATVAHRERAYNSWLWRMHDMSVGLTVSPFTTSLAENAGNLRELAAAIDRFAPDVRFIDQVGN
jgi:hypothetical protein